MAYPGGAEVKPTALTGLKAGDFWWDTGNEQLYAYNGTDFILVGSQDAGPRHNTNAIKDCA